MKVGIHFDHGKAMSPFCQKYEQILSFNKIDFERLHIDEKDFWEKVDSCDYFIFRWGHDHSTSQLAKSFLPIIENDMGIKTFPDQKTCWHFDDKVIQYYLLQANGHPMIKSWIFWDKGDAMIWLKQAVLPLVLKLKRGAGSSNVLLMNDEKYSQSLVNELFSKGILSTHFNLNKKKLLRRVIGKVLRKMSILKEVPNQYWEIEKDYVLFQKYLPGNEYDTRITVIGGRAFAFRRMNRINDFRASGSGIIDYDTSKIDLNLVAKALEISRKMGFQSMAYDFLYDEARQPMICEVSYTYNDDAVFKCPGYWDEQLHWHEGHFYPQYFHLVDLLKMSDLENIVSFNG